jgi:hypothetical protein
MDRVCIIGAGPAGITAAREYQRAGVEVVVIEKEPRIGGRCLTTERGSDLGAVAWVPWYYDEVNAISDEVGVERDWVPFPVSFRLETGRAHFPFGARQLARSGVQSLRYLASHWWRWRGVSGPTITHVSDELQQSFAEFLRAEGYDHFGELGKVQTAGYGYRWDAPAMYHVRYVAPRAMLGTAFSIVRPRFLGGGTGLGFWKGGTQQIWEKQVARHAIEVRLGTTITAIRRGRDGVVVETDRGEVRADALVLACNPRPLLAVLDATDDERRLYDQFRTFDYRTYECTVAALGEGKRLYGSFRENLATDALDRPLVVFKRDEARASCVFYVNASGTIPDDAIARNIAADLARFGARLEEVTAQARFAYAPHVGSDAIARGFFGDVDALQGRNRTILVGAALTFDILAQVIPQTRAMVQRHLASASGGASVRAARSR